MKYSCKSVLCETATALLLSYSFSFAFLVSHDAERRFKRRSSSKEFQSLPERSLPKENGANFHIPIQTNSVCVYVKILEITEHRTYGSTVAGFRLWWPSSLSSSVSVGRYEWCNCNRQDWMAKWIYTFNYEFNSSTSWHQDRNVSGTGPSSQYEHSQI